MYDTHIVVAAPNHPLHLIDRNLTVQDFSQHRELMVKGYDSAFSVQHNLEVWTVERSETSIRAVCMGLGFAWYSKDTIEAELESGELKPLSFENNIKYS